MFATFQLFLRASPKSTPLWCLGSRKSRGEKKKNEGQNGPKMDKKVIRQIRGPSFGFNVTLLKKITILTVNLFNQFLLFK